MAIWGAKKLLIVERGRLDARVSVSSDLRFGDGLEPDAGLGGMGGLHYTVHSQRECLNEGHDWVKVVVVVVAVQDNHRDGFCSDPLLLNKAT